MDESAIHPVEDLEAPGLLTWESEEPRLKGSKCRECGLLMLGDRYACSGCGSVDVDETTLAPTGTVYSWTTVHVFPASEEPVTVAYVDLDDGVRTFARLAAVTAIGTPVRLTASEEGWWFAAEEAP